METFEEFNNCSIHEDAKSTKHIKFSFMNRIKVPIKKNYFGGGNTFVGSAYMMMERSLKDDFL